MVEFVADGRNAVVKKAEIAVVVSCPKRLQAALKIPR